jgi:hypothetical protein
MLAFTIREFCKVHGIAVATYYKMKKAGIGPREMTLPPGKLIRISHEAAARWRAARENPSAAEAKKLARDAERRRQHCIEAAARAIESPDHVANKRREVAS